MKKAILFDMDGVIVDSMPYHFIAWFGALRPLGIRVSCLEVYCKEGENWHKTLIDFIKKGVLKPSEKLYGKVLKERNKIFRKGGFSVEKP